MKSSTGVQILDEVVRISLHVNSLGKGLNPSVLSSCGYIVEKNGVFRKGNATSLSEPKL